MTYHIHCANCQNGIVDKSSRPMIDHVLTIIMVLQTNQADQLQKICSLFERHCRQSKHIYLRQYIPYQNGIVDKLNRTIIYTVLTIRAVQQTNQTDLAQKICSLLERYCRQIKQNYHRHCVNYQNGIVHTSNRPIINNMFSIRTVLQTNQTDLSQTIYSQLERCNSSHRCSY